MKLCAFLIVITMVKVIQEELDAAVRAKEDELGLRLRPCEIEFLEELLLQTKLKDLPPAQKSSPIYKVQLKAASDKLKRLQKKNNIADHIYLPMRAAMTGGSGICAVCMKVSRKVRLSSAHWPDMN